MENPVHTLCRDHLHSMEMVIFFLSQLDFKKDQVGCFFHLEKPFHDEVVPLLSPSFMQY